MKLLIASACASLLGIGWLAFRAEAADDAHGASACPKSAEECDVTVECLPDGTCRIECEQPDGSTCYAILACDEDGGCEVVESGGDCCAAKCE